MGEGEEAPPAADPPVRVTDPDELRELLARMSDVDAMVVLFEVRRVSLGQMYEYNTACGYCDEAMLEEVDLSKVEVAYPDNPDAQEFVFRLPGRSDELVFRHSTLPDVVLQTSAQGLRDGRHLARDLALLLVRVNEEVAPQPLPDRRTQKITLRGQEAALEQRTCMIERWLPSTGLKQQCLDARHRWECGVDNIVRLTCRKPGCRKQQWQRIPIKIDFFQTASREAPRSTDRRHRSKTRSGPQ
jgi:hypothetical protein